MIKTRFIFNPRSGHNARNPGLLEKVRAFIRARDLNATIVPTERPLHARELALRAGDEGCELIVAIGGDGTMNEVAAGVMKTPAVFGLIPCGSGNGLGRHLGIHGSLDQALATLVDGRVRQLDTGTVNDVPFFNAMGLGFDAEIADRFNRLKSRGFKAYVRTTLLALRAHRPEPCVIRAGDAVVRTCAFILGVANSDQYGNNCFIAPYAQVDDGLLDLTVIKNVTALNAAPIGVRLFTKKIGGSSSAVCLRGERFVIERAAPGLFHTDGEVHSGEAVLEVRVRPRSLRMMVPAKRSNSR